MTANMQRLTGALRINALVRVAKLLLFVVSAAEDISHVPAPRWRRRVVWPGTLVLVVRLP